MNAMKRNLLLLIVTLLTAVCPVIAQTETQTKTIVADMTQNSDGSTYTLTFRAVDGAPKYGNGRYDVTNYRPNKEIVYPAYTNVNGQYKDKITKVVFDESVKGVKAKRTDGWFFGLTNLQSIENLKYLDTSEVRDMQYMFYNCRSLTDIDLSEFKTQKAEAMNKMFEGCTGLTSLDLSNLETPQGWDMSCMFYRCSNLKEIKFSSKFETKNVIGMECMFAETAVTSLDLSSFDTSNVKNMSSMFAGCKNLKEIKWPEVFDTSNVTTMSGMFGSCSSLTSLDLSFLKNPNALNIQGMFQNCSNLTLLNVSGLDFKIYNGSTNNFINGCDKLRVLVLGDKYTFSSKGGYTFTRKEHYNDDPIYLIFGFDREKLGDASKNLYTSYPIYPPCYRMDNGRFTIADTLDCNSDYTPKVKAKTDLWLKGRTIKGRTWSTLVVPASVTYDQIVNAVGSCEVCVLDSYDGTTVKFKTTKETIPANTPMLIRTSDNPSTVYNVSFINVDVVSSEGSDLTSTTTPDSEGRYASFIGTYKKEITIGKDCFYYQNNEFRRSNGNSKVNCTRCYFKFSDITADNYGSPAKKFVVDDGTTVTAIDAIDGEPVNVDQPAYNLAGQRVGKDYKGIVIVGGKKILRK